MYMKSLKEQQIIEYLSKIDWKNNSWNYNIIEEDMRRFLGERPSLDVSYKKDVVVNEVRGESREIEMIDKISIVFTDLDDKIKKVEIKI